MLCAPLATPHRQSSLGDLLSPKDTPQSAWFLGDPALACDSPWQFPGAVAEGNDPFDDFEDDDFDDEFDDDFEEDWEDDLTEDDEFPDTFGGAEPEEEEVAEPDEDSPFADDPDFDDA